MIKELTIKNFRSIREASLELGRFTVLNGANNSGKSSVLYALQVLKNVVTNPNRSVDELLNFEFLNLGGLEESVYEKKLSNSIELFIFAEEGYEMLLNKFGLSLHRYNNSLFTEGLEPYKFKGEVPISFPYRLNKRVSLKAFRGKEEINFVWNGISVVDRDKDEVAYDSVYDVVNVSVRALQRADVIPVRRGFTKPIFNQVPMNGTIYTEEEVATHLAIDKNLQAKVAHYFEKITGKRFSVSMGPGGGFFYLQVREPDTPFTTELVNQGMGVNQILFLLAKILYDKNHLICIDEPEIHLHPTLIEQFVKVLVEISEKEGKQFIFSTHSEHWLMSMLAEVNDGNLKAEDLKVYYLTKEGQETKVENQQVYPNGQIEGGLKNFLEAQMRLTNRFFTAETA